MANGRNPKRRGIDSSREGGGFVALPWSVLDSPAYMALSHPAKALLLEIARQYVKDNNGRLLASIAYLKKRGWTSRDVITRAKRELMDAGLIHETAMGHRPNKASWYAITWYSLDRIDGYDAGAAESFRRGAYRENASLRPSHGIDKPLIGPSGGQGESLPRPSHGPIRGGFGTSPRPSGGHHLDTPSPTHN